MSVSVELEVTDSDPEAESVIVSLVFVTANDELAVGEAGVSEPLDAIERLSV